MRPVLSNQKVVIIFLCPTFAVTEKIMLIARTVLELNQIIEKLKAEGVKKILLTYRPKVKMSSQQKAREIQDHGHYDDGIIRRVLPTFSELAEKIRAKGSK